MPKRLSRILMAVGAFAALAVGGAAISGAATSGSTAGTSTATSTSGAPSGSNGGPPGGFTAANAPGTAAHENAEKAVTGANAERAQAAAVASVGSGSKAGAVTTDFHGQNYEVDVTKSDGSTVTVHLDSAFKVQTHPAGPPPGIGGPGTAGGHSGQAPPSGQLPYGQTPPAG